MQFQISVYYILCSSRLSLSSTYLSFCSSEPVVARIQEGSVANFTVLRAGQAGFVATVMYHVEYGDASPGDLTMLTNDTLLVFGEGEWMKNISVAVEDDNVPETDEAFYIILHNATGECGILCEQHRSQIYIGLIL